MGGPSMSYGTAPGHASTGKEAEMKYAFLIYENEAFYGPDKAGPRIQEIVGKHMAFNAELGVEAYRRLGPQRHGDGNHRANLGRPENRA